MAEDLDEIQDLPSSEQAQIDEAGQAPEGEPVGNAESSPAANGDTADTLSIIRDVVSDKQEDTVAGSQPAEGEVEPEEGIQAKEPDNENYTDVPFHKHPRFQQVVREKRAAEQDAVRYRNVETFLRDNGLGAEEAADMLTLGAMLKHNPAAAWEKIRPWAEKAAIAAGAILPPDIMQRVQAGEISPQVAQELSRAKGQQASFEAERQMLAQRQQQALLVQMDTELKNAAAVWGQSRETRDPHFAAKLPALQREIAFLQMTEGRPTSPAAVQAQCERAYASVNSSFRPPQPAAQAAPKRASRPVTGGQVAGTSTAPKPQSTLDIIRMKTGG